MSRSKRSNQDGRWCSVYSGEEQAAPLSLLIVGCVSDHSAVDGSEIFRSGTTITEGLSHAGFKQTGKESTFQAQGKEEKEIDQRQWQSKGGSPWITGKGYQPNGRIGFV